MTSSVPPGATNARTEAIARAWSAGGSDWTVKDSTTRSKAPVHAAGGERTSATSYVTHDPGWRTGAMEIAVGAKSKAVVEKPSAATNSASSPRPQPTTSAGRPAPAIPRRIAHSTSCGRGPPRSQGSRAPDAYIRSKKSSGNDERRRPRALDGHRHRGQHAALPRPADQPEHDDVMRDVPGRVPGREHALAGDPEPLQRRLRAAVARARPRGQALDAQPAERERGHERLGLEV